MSTPESKTERFDCPFDGCESSYSHERSLKSHLSKKHRGGGKKAKKARFADPVAEVINEDNPIAIAKKDAEVTKEEIPIAIVQQEAPSAVDDAKAAPQEIPDPVPQLEKVEATEPVLPHSE